MINSHLLDLRAIFPFLIKVKSYKSYTTAFSLLSHRDSNPTCLIQNQMCDRYTMSHALLGYQDSRSASQRVTLGLSKNLELLIQSQTYYPYTISQCALSYQYVKERLHCYRVCSLLFSIIRGNFFSLFYIYWCL